VRGGVTEQDGAADHPIGKSDETLALGDPLFGHLGALVRRPEAQAHAGEARIGSVQQFGQLCRRVG